jgi:beta-lactamase superfamily II metal-dependent hydrolase
LTYYRELLAQQAEELRTGKPVAASFGATLQRMAKRALAALPFVETLGEDGDTSPCNNTSAITYWQIDGRRILLTGDAGVPAMRNAADHAAQLGHGPGAPLALFQAPHHGSRRNLTPSLLDDLLGTRDLPFSTDTTAVVSASKDAPKHPSPKVTNALQRRGASVFTSENGTLLHHNGGNGRGWGPAMAVGPLDEGEDEDD